MKAVSLAVSAHLPQNTTQVSLSMKVYITLVLFFPVHNINKAEKIKCPICPICEKYFSFKSSLKYHIQGIHEGIRYPCLECNYKSTNKSTLSRHMKTHTKIKHMVFPFANSPSV